MSTDNNSQIINLIKSPIFLVAAGLVGVVVLYVGIRSPVVLIGLGAVAIAVIYIVLTRSPDIPNITIGPRCPSGVAFRCPDGTTQCGQTCSDTEIWDCTSKKCICSGTNQLCVNNTQCCSPCENDACCSSNNQISKNGVISCCPPGTVPSSSTPNSTPNSSSNSPPPANDTCSVACGRSTCKEGEACMKVTHLLEATFTKLRTDSNVTGSGTSADEGNWITFCYGKPNCTFSDESASPNAINNNYPYFDLDISSQPGNKFSLCINNDKTSSDTSCYGITNDTDCSASSSCKWVTLPDDYDGNNLVGPEFQKYMNYKNGGSDNGYYCDPGQLSLGRLVYYKATGGDCSWQSCINHVISPGTVDMAWNQSTLGCTAVKVPPYENIGYQSKIPCTGIGKPCSSCTSASDFVDAIPCTGDGNPCKNCTASTDGTYKYICLQDGQTCEPTSDNSAWVFNTCAPTASDGTEVRVLGPADTKGSGGNCPWGCSKQSGDTGPGGGICYNKYVPPGTTNIFGDTSSSSDQIVCLQTGKIVPEPQSPTYIYDPTQFICSQSSSSGSSGLYKTLCACIDDVYNGKVAISIAENYNNGFLIYQKASDGTRHYLYYNGDNQDPWFNYVPDFDNASLMKGNLNFIAGTGTMKLVSYSGGEQLDFGVAYSNSKFQFIYGNKHGKEGSSEPIGWNNAYADVYLPQGDNGSLLYNTPYTVTLLGNAGWDIPTIASMENQTMQEEDGITPEAGNYVYFTRYVLEIQMQNQNCPSQS